MDCNTERIIQVSLSKITDSRRRRGGPTLRRNLLVSHVLNNVLTKSDPAYATYRNTVDIDVDLDNAETEIMALDKPKVSRDDTGGSLRAGNGQECSHSLGSAARSTKGITETAPKVACQTTAEKDKNATDSFNTKKRKTDNKAVGTKRPRSQYANEPCEKHAVWNKRWRSENESENCADLEYQEPMDISGLITVFSGSLSGLSGLSSASSDSAGAIPCFSSQQTVGYSFNAWPQTVEAF